MIPLERVFWRPAATIITCRWTSGAVPGCLGGKRRRGRRHGFFHPGKSRCVSWRIRTEYRCWSAA